MTDDVAAVIASLEEQERRLVFDRFDNADAWALGVSAGGSGDVA